MQDYEKLGLFYLGKLINPATGKIEDTPLLYQSKDLTTHAVCVGMTGSGKTGLGITILEEAGIDKIPAIIIDPKGDLSNLMLTFPNLTPEEFKPWIDSAEAEGKGMDPDSYAASVAKTWKDGLAAWGESPERIQNLRKAVDIVVYTPASQAGIPISILSSFAAPTKEEMVDSAAIRDKIASLTASLLGLLGINADPLKSRENILISTLIQQSWQSGVNLDIPTLIEQVQKPPLSKIGALDIDTFYPAKDRMALSISLNNLLASPGFQAWMEGVPLDIGQFLHTEEGKPKLSIISIAHLSDSERMFFVTLLLNQFASWMRRQSGTSSLRAILYMDEIFGFFPPTASPPSKLPMLTLLKQARAFGIGIVLATQNPVDLDYKGLANCGTWFIGKLQTDRDKSRVIEGLNTASNGELDSKKLDQMLALTGNRTFIMRSVHEKEPILFQTRWTLSYLRGPLTLVQIASLTDKSKVIIEDSPEVKTAPSDKIDLPPSIPEFFVQLNDSEQPVHYEPKIVGIAKMHFVDSKNKIDTWEEVYYAVSPNGDDLSWDKGENCPELKTQLKKEPISKSTFGQLPSFLSTEKNYSNFAKQLATTLYQNQTYKIFQTVNPNRVSKPDESERDFRARIALELRENRDDLVKKLREKYASKISSLTDKIQRSQQAAAEKQQKVGMQQTQTLISFGSTLAGALFGRGVTKGTISQAGTSLRRATQISKDSQDASAAEQNVAGYQQQLQDLETEMNGEIASLTGGDAESIKLETTEIRPRKSDISVEKVILAWWPV